MSLTTEQINEIKTLVDNEGLSFSEAEMKVLGLDNLDIDFDIDEENKDIEEAIEELESFDYLELEIEETKEIIKKELSEEEKEEIDREYWANKASEDCNTPSELVKVFFAREDFQVSFASIVKSNSKGKVKNLDFKYIRALFSEWCLMEDVPARLSKDTGFDNAITILKEQWYSKEIEKLEIRLNEVPKLKSSELWAEFQKITGFKNNDIIVLKGWIYNIKKILRGGSSAQIPAPVFYSSKQGIGKSLLTRLLCECLKSFYQQVEVKQLNDSFSKALFSKLLVADFDELAGFDKADSNIFKKWMTSDKSQSRSMRSENINEYDKVTQPIGSCNKPIAAVWNDTTGSRRFWQIDCNLYMAKDIKQFAKEDKFLMLWQSVDMDESNPYEDNRKELENIAFETQRRSSETEDFINAFINSKDFKEDVQASVFYKKYVEYCIDNGDMKKSSKFFGIALTEGKLGNFITKRKTKGVMVYSFDVSNKDFKEIKEDDSEEMPF